MDIEWPLSFRWARANGITKLVPWHFLVEGEGSSVDEQFKKERTDLREVKTFARRQDCDDFAGFLVVDRVVVDRVIYFHPCFSPGPNEYMINGEYDGFWTFFREIIVPDTIDWSSEDDLNDVK